MLQFIYFNTKYELIFNIFFSYNIGGFVFLQEKGTLNNLSSLIYFRPLSRVLYGQNGTVIKCCTTNANMVNKAETKNFATTQALYQYTMYIYNENILNY